MQYAGWVNPYGASIGDLIARSGDAEAHAAEMTAAAQARAAEIRGQAWGGAVQNIAQIPGQIQLAKNQQLDQQLKRQQLQEGIDAKQEVTRQRIVTTIGKLANSSKTPDDFVSSLNDMVGLGGLPKDVAAHIAAQVQAAGPDSWEGVQRKYVDFGSQYAQLQKVSKDDRLIDQYGNTKVPAVPSAPKTRAELAADAADPNSPTHFQSAAALKMDKPEGPKSPAELAADAANPNSPTQAQSTTALGLLQPPKPEKAPPSLDEQLLQAITSGDQATAGRITQTMKTAAAAKGDPAAIAAANRQAATIDAQMRQQQRSQAFTEAQAGRGELTNKVEAPYLDAREKADTLRNVVALAKSGNKEAANVQGLLGVLGLVTSEGVKRINTTELDQVAGAGSLLDKIKGRAGSLTSGQPIPADLQDDLVQLSNMLEQSARKKYENGFKQIKTRYGLKDETAMAPSGSPDKGTERTVGGQSAVWDYRNDQWGWWPK